MPLRETDLRIGREFVAIQEGTFTSRELYEYMDANMKVFRRGISITKAAFILKQLEEECLVYSTRQDIRRSHPDFNGEFSRWIWNKEVEE